MEGEQTNLDEGALRCVKCFVSLQTNRMDLVISGGEDTLLESLNFSLPPSTSYVQQRRLVSYYPSGASTLSPAGVRVCRYNINGDWLDPASMRIYGKIANTGAGVLQLASGPHCLFSRIRLLLAELYAKISIFTDAHMSCFVASLCQPTGARMTV